MMILLTIKYQAIFQLVCKGKLEMEGIDKSTGKMIQMKIELEDRIEIKGIKKPNILKEEDKEKQFACPETSMETMSLYFKRILKCTMRMTTTLMIMTSPNAQVIIIIVKKRTNRDLLKKIISGEALEFLKINITINRDTSLKKMYKMITGMSLIFTILKLSKLLQTAHFLSRIIFRGMIYFLKEAAKIKKVPCTQKKDFSQNLMKKLLKGILSLRKN